MINDFSRDNFINDFAKLIKSYIKEDLSYKEEMLALTPARVLEAILMAYYKLNLSTPYDSLEEYPVLSCNDLEDCLKTIDIIENVAAKFAVMYGDKLYEMYREECQNTKYNKEVLGEYVMPSIIAVASYHILRPSISATDKLFKYGVDIRKTN